MKILCADQDLYLAEIGSPATLRVALGPRVAPDYDRSYWEKGGSGAQDAFIRIYGYMHLLLLQYLIQSRHTYFYTSLYGDMMSCSCLVC